MPQRKPKFVLLYTPLVTVGGAERQFLEEYRYLKNRDVDCVGITFEFSDRAMIVEGICKRDFEIIPCSTVFEKVISLRRKLKQLDCSLLVAHTSLQLAYLATVGTSIPYVYFFNSPPYYKGYPENLNIYSWLYQRAFAKVLDAYPTYKQFIRRDVHYWPWERAKIEAKAILSQLALNHARAVFVLSQKARWAFQRVFGIEATVVRGCVADSLFNYKLQTDVRRSLSIEESQPMLLSISRLDPIKRLDLLIHSFVRVLQEIPSAVLIIGGTGPDASYLHTLVESLSLTKNVIFVGYVPENRLWDFYASCDLFVAPAIADYNIAPFEALALGRKVVWSVEMEAESWLLQSGFVFPACPTDEAFASAILTGLRSETHGKPDLTSFTWSYRGDRLINIYENIIGSARRLGTEAAR